MIEIASSAHNSHKCFSAVCWCAVAFQVILPFVLKTQVLTDWDLMIPTTLVLHQGHL